MWNISSANPTTPEAAIYSCGGVAPHSIPPAPRPNQGEKAVTTAAQVVGSVGHGVGGLVRHICVNGSNIMWSAEDSLVGDAPGLPIGMVYMFDPANLSALPLKVTVPASYLLCCAVHLIRWKLPYIPQFSNHLICTVTFLIFLFTIVSSGLRNFRSLILYRSEVFC